jgi:hypothetical protein
MLYAVPLKAAGAPPEVCGAAWMLGAQLGVLPDALPWLVGKLTGRGDLEQWLRKPLHNPPKCGRRWMMALVSPYFAHVLPDSWIHAPGLPDPGTSPFHDRVLIRIRSWRVTVRDGIWCTGELVMWVIVFLLVQLYRVF